MCLSGRTQKKTLSTILAREEKQKQSLKSDLLYNDIKTQLSK